jgi:hypothetical protein
VSSPDYEDDFFEGSEEYEEDFEQTALGLQEEVAVQRLELHDAQHAELAMRMARASRALERWSIERVELVRRVKMLRTERHSVLFIEEDPYPVNDDPVWLLDARVAKEQRREDQRRIRRRKQARTDQEASELLRSMLTERGLDGRILVAPPRGRPNAAETERRVLLGDVLLEMNELGVKPSQLVPLSNRGLDAVSNLLGEARARKAGNAE